MPELKNPIPARASHPFKASPATTGGLCRGAGVQVALEFGRGDPVADGAANRAGPQPRGAARPAEHLRLCQPSQWVRGAS